MTKEIYKYGERSYSYVFFYIINENSKRAFRFYIILSFFLSDK